MMFILTTALTQRHCLGTSRVTVLDLVHREVIGVKRCPCIDFEFDDL